MDKPSRFNYIVLALIGGLIGIHNFYEQKVALGIIKLILTLIIVGIPINIIWIYAEIMSACSKVNDDKFSF